MKTTSLIQPFAMLAILNEKLNETRPKGFTGFKYRGPLAIHASAKFPKEYRELCEQEPFKSTLAKHGYTADNLPLGCVLGIVEQHGDQIMTQEFIDSVQSPERDFGFYEIGRRALFWRGAFKFPKPFPAKGQLGLWSWTPPPMIVPPGTVMMVCECRPGGSIVLLNPVDDFDNEGTCSKCGRVYTTKEEAE